MILKTAFNALTRIHSRAATLKRLGTPNIYSPVRITPSNYFRFLAGPSATTIHGREFILPIDSMTGHATQRIRFFTIPIDVEVPTIPTEGSFHLTYGVTDTASLAFDALASDIQTALRAITGLGYVTVTGDFSNGFIVTFIGVDGPTLLVPVQETPPLDVDIGIEYSNSTPWSPRILRGDKIIDSVYGHLAIDEIIEIVDIGGSIMGWRCRAE